MSRPVCRCLFLLFVFASLPCGALAQRGERDRDSWLTTTGTVEISGQVRLADGAGQASDVTVRVERFGGGGTLDQMQVDNRGRFRFANLPRGQYLVSVSARCLSAPQQQAELVHVFRSYLLFELMPDSSSPDCHRAAEAGAPGLVDARVPAEALKAFDGARAALRQKKVKDGIDRLKRAIEIYPDFFEAHLLLGTTYMEAREWEKSDETLGRAAGLNDKSALALFSLGEVRRQRKLYTEAEAALRAGLKLEEASWQGHFTLGRLYLETNEVMKAAPHIGRTLQLKPDFAEAHLFGGNILLKVGQPARALVEYEEYLRLAPDGEYAAPTRELVGKLRKSLPAGKKN
jgi:tetratricopeptide (TPR) repeat protein